MMGASLWIGTPRLLAALALLLAALLALIPSSVDAHANYVDSEPPANSTLEAAPERVFIRFTEPLEPSLSYIRVLDAQGQRVDDDDTVVSSTDPLSMAVALRPLGNGAYTVVWKNVSTVDGHSARGSFAFSVGEPLPADAAPQAEIGVVLHSPIEPFLRWIMILGAGTAFGGLVFRLLVAKPAIRASPMADLDEDSGRAGVLRIMFLGNMLICGACLMAAMFAAFGLIVVRAAIVYESSILGAFAGPMWELQTDTFWGRMAIARLGLMSAGLLFMNLVSDAGDRRSNIRTYAAIACLACALLTISLTSHAAALREIRLEAVVNDYAHLIAASVWIGGLITLASYLSEIVAFAQGSDRRALIVGTVRRFSPIAAACVGTLAMTGVFSAWAQVGTPEALTLPYGWAFIGKTALVLVALALAGVNLLWVTPRLKIVMEEIPGAEMMRRVARLEYAALALALLAVGFMASMEPARQMAARMGIGVESEFAFEDTSEGTNIKLSVEPGAVGLNDVFITLADADGEPVTDATDVRLRLSYLDDDLGETARSAANVGDGEYELRGQTIGIAGAWQAEVVAQRRSAFDARTAFRFEVESGGGGGQAFTPDPGVARNLFGIELGIVGLVLLAVAVPLGGRYTRAGLTAMGTGTVGVVAGVVLLFGAFGTGDGVPVRNPIAPTGDSVAAGRDVYQTYCQSCHGEYGLGDGPAAVGLNPPAADLTVHVPLHPDRALFEFIRDGIPGTSMAGRGDTLTDDEMWHVVNYIQTLK